jgi:purine-binding chemotaxis protein CheW
VLEKRRHALALGVVERVIPMAAISSLPQAPPIALGVINVGGAIVPVFDLRARFALPCREYGLDAHLVLVRTPRRRLALAADQVLGVSEVAAEAVTAPDTAVPAARSLAGIVALSDGLLFIHDLDALLSLDEEQQLTRALETTTG